MPEEREQSAFRITEPTGKGFYLARETGMRPGTPASAKTPSVKLEKLAADPESFGIELFIKAPPRASMEWQHASTRERLCKSGL